MTLTGISGFGSDNFELSPRAACRKNIDEVHLSDDDKQLDWNRRAVCLPTLTLLQLLLRAAVADDAEPTRLPISGVGATGT